MPAPSPLAIATSSVQRLIKEEASYHKELKLQEARLEKLQARTEEDENREYSLKQEVSSSYWTPNLSSMIVNKSQRTAIEETKAVFPPLRQRIEDALAKLQERLEADGGRTSEEESTKAKQIIEEAQKIVKSK